MLFLPILICTLLVPESDDIDMDKGAATVTLFVDEVIDAYT